MLHGKAYLKKAAVSVTLPASHTPPIADTAGVDPFRSMNVTSRSTTRTVRPTGFTLMEILVTMSVVMVLAGLTLQVMKNGRQKAHLVRATQKIKDLGQSFMAYTGENGGLLPRENHSGSGDTWEAAAEPEAREVWYNALLLGMAHKSVGEIGEDGEPQLFYEDSYPLHVPGAPYPKSEKKLKAPLFAIGMNSRLQRRENETGHKPQGTVVSIQAPVNTVIFLERGMPKDKKVVSAQANFSASPKAGPKAFAARHNQRGLLLFADGHVEVKAPADIITGSGKVKTLEEGSSVVWTRDPDDDPN